MTNSKAMKKSLLGGAAALAMVVAISAPASAADVANLYAAPTLANWTGLYIGAHVGIGDANIDGRFNPSELPGDEWTNDSGLVGGVQMGYNWQSGGFVYGLEVDLSTTGFEANACNDCVNGSEVAHAEIDLLASLRARAGMLMNDTNLIYVTGGIAYRDGDWHTFGDSGLANSGGGDEDIDKVGGVLGLGWEWMAASNASLRVEGLWYFFGDSEYAPDCCNTVGTDLDMDPLVARVGVNFHF